MFYRSEEEFRDRTGYLVDGSWYPRVTSIVSIKAKPGLASFYREVGDEEKAEEIKQKSADEGTLVHETVEAILLGKEPAVDPSITPSIEAFRAFLAGQSIQVDPDWVERRVAHHDERYAGTVDAVALIDGKLGVLDIKTSQSIYRDYNLQTSAYVMAIQPQLRSLRTRWILRIDQTHACTLCGASKRMKGGREKVRTNGNGGGSSCPHAWSELRGVVEMREFPYYLDDYRAFLGAKKLWEWEHAYWLERMGY